MFNHSTHVRDWLLPILMIILGGFLAIQNHEMWVWAGSLMWVMAFIMSLWLGISSIYDEASELERERTDKVEADIKFYQLILSMNPDDRIQFGIGSAKDTVMLELDRTQAQGSYSKGYRIISISPAKLRAIAYSCLAGSAFSSRVLAGGNKILSETEYYRLRDELIEYGLLLPRSEKDERQGYYWTEEGKKFLQEIVDSPT